MGHILQPDKIYFVRRIGHLTVIGMPAIREEVSGYFCRQEANMVTIARNIAVYQIKF